MHEENADVFALRAIGSRAFVQTEASMSKFEDRAWEGVSCGPSINSKAHGIYKLSAPRVVEIQNVIFV